MAYLRVLPRNNRGFTIVEVLSVAFILIVVFAALFITLTTGEFSNAVSSAKADLQANVRTAVNSIVKDVRQTSIIQINNSDNNPSGTHIKFKKVIGINNTTGGYDFSGNYIDYNYDQNLSTLTRSEIDASSSIRKIQVFNDITQAPFYTAVEVPLTSAGVGSGGKLIVVISGRGHVRGGLDLTFSLTEELKIRNE